ncbi:MAG: hypothetical protein HOP07_15545 [Bacteriovoracaceae bacterium]|nr:hypothetical protein [Bacteriovoracaceae bacterium]
MKFYLLFLFCSLIFSSLIFGATYEVPTNENLKQYAKFELKNFRKKANNNSLTLKYHLPELLVGNSSRIILKGELKPIDEVIILTGENAKAECVGAYESMNCSIVYNDLVIDEASALKAIQSISRSPEEFSARLKIMRDFSTDPVGFISY